MSGRRGNFAFRTGLKRIIRAFIEISSYVCVSSFRQLVDVIARYLRSINYFTGTIVTRRSLYDFVKRSVRSAHAPTTTEIKQKSI